MAIFPSDKILLQNVSLIIGANLRPSVRRMSWKPKQDVKKQDKTKTRVKIFPNVLSWKRIKIKLNLNYPTDNVGAFCSLDFNINKTNNGKQIRILPGKL